MENTSWENEAKWYDTVVSEKGHYYHQKIIFPRLLKILNLKHTKNPSLLDLACGQGVLSRILAEDIRYTGIDLSPSLIKSAIQFKKIPHHFFLVADVTSPLPLKEKDFSHAVLVLCLQNIASPQKVLENAKKHLRPGGKLVMVLNHPCFRIPRQSSWQINEKTKMQSRCIHRYLSLMKIPIQSHPGKNDKVVLWSYHYPLSMIFQFLKEAGFVTMDVQEWCSDKKSTGKNAKMENRARAEFPLFLTIVAKS